MVLIAGQYFGATGALGHPRGEHAPSRTFYRSNVEWPTKPLNQPRLTWGKIIPPTLRYHERQQTHVPGAAFKFNQLPIGQILGDEMVWQAVVRSAKL